MKVLMINSSPHEHGCTAAALGEVAAVLSARGVASEVYWLGVQPIPGCIACGSCKTRGRCVVADDGVNALAARAPEFDGLIVGTPVYYGGPCGQATAFLDRFFFVSRRLWAKKPGAAVVSCRRGGATAAFDRLNKYFTISNMPLVPSQYWNQVHGNTPEEVRLDAEGMQTMRTLGENMAWLLACIAAGRRAGVPEPEYEPGVRTNFVR